MTSFPAVPAKSVGHDTHAEGAHHAAHTKDGNGNAPHDGADARVDGHAVTLHPGVVEERSEFLRTEKDNVGTTQLS